jgi:hypothetical protein
MSGSRYRWEQGVSRASLDARGPYLGSTACLSIFPSCELGRPVGGVFVRRGSVRGVKALVPSPVLSPGRRGFSQARGAHPFLLCPIGRNGLYRRGIVYVSAGPVRNNSSRACALCYHQPRGVVCPLRTP